MKITVVSSARRLMVLAPLFLLAVLLILAPRPALAAFGVTSSGGYFTVDTGSKLVFKVNQSNGDINSLKYNGVEYQEPAKGSHINSGLGSGCTVTATTYGTSADPSTNYVKITVFDSSQTLTHYYIARSGFNNIYMATYYTQEPAIGLVRFIVRIPQALLSNGPNESDIRNNTGAIESADIFGYADGTTRSKHYSGRRLIDYRYIGANNSATNPTTGVYMVRSNHEGGSGGPFYRSLINQCGDDQEIYEILNYGEAQTEAFRLSILNGPYVLCFTGGGVPASTIDTAFFDGLGLMGYVGAADRGIVNGKANGIPAGFQGVVGFANATAQGWSIVSNSNYVSPAMIPGTYTQTLYKGELAVATQQVTVTAGTTVTKNITSAELTPTTIWKIGEWDGTPGGFLNADKATLMHPSDSRLSAWAPGPYTVGTSTPAQFPAYQWKDINNGQVVNFNLTSAQISNLTLRIGLTVAYEGARPKITLNNFTSGNPVASTQPDSRTLTVGTYRGNNVVYSYNIPASAFVVGQNTLSITAISGSGASGYLSAGYSYDALELDQPAANAYWNGSLSANWNAISTASSLNTTNFNTDATSGINLNQIPGTATNVFFAANGATNLSSTLAQPFDIQSLTALASTGAVSVGGTSQLTLGAGGLNTQSGAGGLTVTAPVALKVNQTWNGAATTPLLASGVVSGSAALTTAGNVTLGGANTYSGGTTVTSGTLQTGNNAALAGGALAVTGGSVDLNGKTVGVGNLTGSAGASVSNSSTTSAILATNATGDTLFAGNLVDGGAGKTVALAKTGSAALSLSGSNQYSGLTSVQAGTLAITGGSLGVAAPNTTTSHLEIAPANSGVAAVSLANGATVNVARTIIGGNVANTAGGSATLTQSGGTLNSAQWLTVGSQGSGSSIFNLQGGAVNVNSAGGTQLEVATFAGASGTLNIGANAQINLLNNANLALGVINGGSGNGVVNQSGGAVTFYSDAGMATGGSGSLALGLGTGRTGSYTYNLSGGTLTVPSIKRVSGAGTFVFNGGTLQATTSSSAFMSGLSNAFVKSGGALINSNGQNITIAQPLLADATSAGGGLTKSGAGTLTLSGSNTYGGPSSVSAGILALGASERLADASGLALAGTSTFATAGFSETLGALSLSDNATATLDLGAGTSIIKFASMGAGTGALSVINYSGSQSGGSTDQFVIGTSATLTSAQLSQISFLNPGTNTGTFAATQLSSGEVVPLLATTSDVSSSISVYRSAASRNRVTERYKETVILKNTGTAAVNGPFYLIIDGLTSNATLFNASGTTSKVPIGRPYLTVSIASLPAGATQVVVLEFAVTNNIAYTFTSRVLAGSAAP